MRKNVCALLTGNHVFLLMLKCYNIVLTRALQGKLIRKIKLVSKLVQEIERSEEEKRNSRLGPTRPVFFKSFLNKSYKKLFSCVAILKVNHFSLSVVVEC